MHESVFNACRFLTQMFKFGHSLELPKPIVHIQVPSDKPEIAFHILPGNANVTEAHSRCLEMKDGYVHAVVHIQVIVRLRWRAKISTMNKHAFRT